MAVAGDGCGELGQGEALVLDGACREVVHEGAAGLSMSRWANFNLSTVIVSILPPMSILKVLGPLSMILKGGVWWVSLVPSFVIDVHCLK